MKRTVFYLFFACLTGHLVAQNDTITEIKKDTALTVTEKDEMYKHQVQERPIASNHLWKLNLVDLGLFRPNVAYEHRLSRSWSVEGYASIGGVFEYPLSMNAYSFNQQFKYYFNLNRRERLGRRTDGFRGDYFSSLLIYDNRRVSSSNISNSVDNNSGPYLINSFSTGILYGIQRRIGSLVYFDVYVGGAYRWEKIADHSHTSNGEDKVSYSDYFIPVFGISAGIAIGSFDNLRRELKR